MGPIAAALSQQGHTEHHASRDFELMAYVNVLWDKLFNDVEHRTLQATIHFQRNFWEIQYCKSCNFLKQWDYFCEIFKDFVTNLSPVNPEIAVKNLLVVEKFLFVR